MTKVSYQLIDKSTKEVKLETLSWPAAKKYQETHGGVSKVELRTLYTPVKNPPLKQTCGGPRTSGAGRFFVLIAQWQFLMYKYSQKK